MSAERDLAVFSAAVQVKNCWLVGMPPHVRMPGVQVAVVIVYHI